MNNFMSNDFGNYQWGANTFYNNEYFFRKENEKRILKKLGLYTGAAVLGTVVLQYAFIAILQVFDLVDKYYADAYFSSAFDILIAIFTMLVPFSYFGKKMSEISGNPQPIALSGPYRKSLMVPAVIAGVGFCVLGSIINSYISLFFSSVDVELTAPEIPMAEGFSGIILTFFRVAITAAVVEELSLRGFVMGNLRYYGDGFAIAVSSFIFAAMHGNMVQAPFAFMAGFALGYLSIKTGTLWTGVIIHALNNGLSVAVYYLSKEFGEDEIAVPYALFVYAVVIVGMISFAYFNKKSKDIILSQGASVLSTGEKTTAFFGNATMIITILYMLYITADYISVGS